MLKTNDIILFQGDSITDAGRYREITTANDRQALGSGYCNYLAAQLLRAYPGYSLKFYNRGISGDRIVDLYDRWKGDSLSLSPTVISILIGVNDTWHSLTDQNGVELDEYEAIYRQLLQDTLTYLPQVKLILGEPFVLQCGIVTEIWLEEMSQRQAIVKKLAEETGACLVPFQRALNEALRLAPPHYWTTDGVHPTVAGHQVLAETWYQHVMGEGLIT